MPAGARGHYKIQCNARWQQSWPIVVPANGRMRRHTRHTTLKLHVWIF